MNATASVRQEKNLDAIDRRLAILPILTNTVSHAYSFTMRTANLPSLKLSIIHRAQTRADDRLRNDQFSTRAAAGAIRRGMAILLDQCVALRILVTRSRWPCRVGSTSAANAFIRAFSPPLA